MDIHTLLTSAGKVWTALHSEKTREEIDAILEITDDIRDKIMKSFHIAADAADDVVDLTCIVIEAAERIRGAALEGTRDMVKPISQVMTLEDITDLVLVEYWAGRTDGEAARGG